MLILYELLGIPYEIVVRLKSYALCRTIRGEDSLKEKLLRRDTWDDGINELQKLLGDDPDGIKILWELLNIVSLNSRVDVLTTLPKYNYAMLRKCTKCR